MKKGTIKTFNAERGFGFIRPADGSAEIFFHISVVKDMGYPVEEGSPVEYEDGPGRKPGERQATRVIVTGEPSANPAPVPRGDIALPPDCVFKKSFYDESGHLRQELFYHAAEKVADIFRRAQLKATQLRQLYNGFLSFARRLADRSISFEDAKERFGTFYCERIVRQHMREILPAVVKAFFDEHRELALSSDREMLGLFRYLTNIYCYFGEQEKGQQR
ncbi:MAG: cold shock domain-containing protein [Thermoguttaceae bacterium]|nr:cold shock domain-containing protein [Thermoguttaceae bacterium]MDW8080165.1 cold shock domain-containing protein [Thermoguttaceae bacterium]